MGEKKKDIDDFMELKKGKGSRKTHTPRGRKGNLSLVQPTF